MDELKPCPFCGGESDLFCCSGKYVNFIFCKCNVCGAKTKSVPTKTEITDTDFWEKTIYEQSVSVEQWNRRSGYGKTKMPMGSMTYAIACRICKNRNSDKCAACKMEIQSGFELDGDAFKEALVDG